MNKDTITLTDDHGVDHNYELLDAIMYQDNLYCVFYPTEEGDTEVLILRADSNEDPSLTTFNFVEDEKIVDAVFDLFKKRNTDINFQ